MSVLSENTLTEAPRLMFDQIPGPRGPAKLTKQEKQTKKTQPYKYLQQTKK